MLKKLFSKNPDEKEKEKRLEEKRNRLKNAKPEEIYRKPNPQANLAYPEEDIFELIV